MTYTPVLVIITLVLVIFMAGCTASQPSGTQPTPSPSAVGTLPVPSTSSQQALPPDLTGSWRLSGMSVRGGTAVVTPTAEISLIINPDGTLSGYDGCNHYFGSAHLTGIPAASGPGLKVGALSSTKKYCSGVAEQEQQYLNILEKTVSFTAGGARLTLIASTNDTLVYQRSV